ncbi:MAG: nucleotide exchange factor GrpE [Candidatus Micrarchaeota archaeon]|nr:nucleotide exchange factor GrpE [Candidatus Micrarchaeota archaeon]
MEGKDEQGSNPGDLQENKKQETEKKTEKSAEKPDGEAAELKDRLVRMAAEFDNYKKRVTKEIESSKNAGRMDVVRKLLPTLDEFELAINSFAKDDEKSVGIAMIYANFAAALKAFGLREIDAKGVFDPYKHEIVLSKESKEGEGTIIEVVRKGYEINGVMLRPASVIVSKGIKAAGKE